MALPQNVEDDFRSQSYWDVFFQKRQGKAFEWYGEWPQLKPLVFDICRDKKMLVPGCGNSDLSSLMYDDGCVNITNVDFSKVAIKHMLTSNLRARPKMKWAVMDMTKTTFGDGSFDVVFDKGSIDALMSESSDESQAVGSRYLEEMKRVLAVDVGSAFLCVTSAQPHIVAKICRAFGSGWAVTVRRVEAPKDTTASDMQPYLFIVTRVTVRDDGLAAPIDLQSGAVVGPGDQQFRWLEGVLGAENEARLKGRGSESDEDAASDAAAFADYDQLHPGRRLVLFLQARDGRQRYRAVVLDAPVGADTAGGVCSVFIVPQGREHEFIFATAEGNWQLRNSAKCSRLIAVSMLRGESYGGLEAVKLELNTMVLPLSPTTARQVVGSIPYLTAGGSFGVRCIIESAVSPMQGEVVVEDVEDEKTRVRRMVFMSNRNLIQSEIALCKRAGGGKRDKVEWVPDLDAPLAFEYHEAVVAALRLVGKHLDAARRDGGAAALVVGLGGGGLPMHLAGSLGMRVECIELDPTVVRLANKHFGVDKSSVTVVTADGLSFVADRAAAGAAKYDVIVIDAGSADASLGMSCPPRPFVERPFLEACRSCLHPKGALAVNCVARSKSLYETAAAQVGSVFSEVHEVGVEEGNVNRVLVALPQPCEAAGKDRKKLGAKLLSAAAAPLAAQAPVGVAAVAAVD